MMKEKCKPYNINNHSPITVRDALRSSMTYAPRYRWFLYRLLRAKFAKFTHAGSCVMQHYLPALAEIVRILDLARK